MLGVVIITFTLVVGQVYMDPPAFTMDDDGDNVYTGIRPNEGDGGVVEIISIEKPIDWSGSKSVAGKELYQGDMLLTDEQWSSLRTRKATDDVTRRWTEGDDGYPRVPYVFQDDVNQDNIRAALDYWMNHTCIKFEETTNTDQPHLQFYIGGDGECSSAVGMVYWANGQQVSIGAGCETFGVIVHEVGHAMGFWHEQSRSDRDDYVHILEENIIDTAKAHAQFDKENDNNYSVPYDYASIMHYRIDSFSDIGNPTIITLDPFAQEFIGSRKGLTHRDIMLANKMYDCIGKWLTSCDLSSDPCLNDGYIGADCTCVCPAGTSGTTCQLIVGDYYDDRRSSLTEKITTEMTITIVAHFKAGDRFTKWIVPDTCKRAMVTFTSDQNMYRGDCKIQYLYVRTDPTDYNGQILCKSDVSAGVTLTSDTGIAITMINKVTYSGTGTFWSADVIFEDIVGCDNSTTTATPTPSPTTITTTPTPSPTTTTTQTPSPTTTTPTPSPTTTKTTPTPSPTTTTLTPYPTTTPTPSPTSTTPTPSPTTATTTPTHSPATTTPTPSPTTPTPSPKTTTTSTPTPSPTTTRTTPTPSPTTPTTTPTPSTTTTTKTPTPSQRTTTPTPTPSQTTKTSTTTTTTPPSPTTTTTTPTPSPTTTTSTTTTPTPSPTTRATPTPSPTTTATPTPSPTITTTPTPSPTTTTSTTTPTPSSTTTAATTATETTTITTTSPPAPLVKCSKRRRKVKLNIDQCITITSPKYPDSYPYGKVNCGWTLQAKWPSRLFIDCPQFELNQRDVLKINRRFFKGVDAPNMISKSFGIKFYNRKRSSGPGFQCTVCVLNYYP